MTRAMTASSPNPNVTTPAKAALFAAAVLLLSGVAAQADNSAIRNCNWCHGSSAQGYAPAPRLAGQRAAYIASQLSAFRDHRRDAPFSKQYMWAAASRLDGATIRALATYYASLPALPAHDGDRGRVAKGEAIYQHGMPEANVVACVACHGPNAEGVRDIPRLGGLSYTYLKQRLEQWSEGYHSAMARPMPHIAGNLSRDDAEAVASYLSYLK
jgi:cytochrome c553